MAKSKAGQGIYMSLDHQVLPESKKVLKKKIK